MDGKPFVIAVGVRDLKFRQAAGQTFAVTVKVDQLAVKDAGHLIDAVSHQETTVKDRDLRLRLGHIVSVHIDGAAHR